MCVGQSSKILSSHEPILNFVLQWQRSRISDLQKNIFKQHFHISKFNQSYNIIGPKAAMLNFRIELNLQTILRIIQVTFLPKFGSDTRVFRRPVTSDKNFRSQNISLTFFVKKP
jgi:hypothetical protein